MFAPHQTWCWETQIVCMLWAAGALSTHVIGSYGNLCHNSCVLGSCACSGCCKVWDSFHQQICCSVAQSWSATTNYTGRSRRDYDAVHHRCTKYDKLQTIYITLISSQLYSWRVKWVSIHLEMLQRSKVWHATSTQMKSFIATLYSTTHKCC